jgi:hypothetical protein
MTTKTIFSRLLALWLVAACSTSPVAENDASTDASSDGSSSDASPRDAQQEAAVVTCTTPGAPCMGGGACFFAVGDCTATTGVCSDNSFCDAAPTETVCHCDGTQTPVPQCGPGGYALVKAASFGPCMFDAGFD